MAPTAAGRGTRRERPSPRPRRRDGSSPQSRPWSHIRGGVPASGRAGAEGGPRPLVTGAEGSRACRGGCARTARRGRASRKEEDPSASRRAVPRGTTSRRLGHGRCGSAPRGLHVVGVAIMARLKPRVSAVSFWITVASEMQHCRCPHQDTPAYHRKNMRPRGHRQRLLLTICVERKAYVVRWYGPQRNVRQRIPQHAHLQCSILEILVLPRCSYMAQPPIPQRGSSSPKVSQSHVSVVVEEHILRLQVTVNNV